MRRRRVSAGRRWHLRKRVPRRFSAIDPRGLVTVALRTDLRTGALARAAEAERELIATWEAMASGIDRDAARKAAAAARLAAVTMRAGD